MKLFTVPTIADFVDALRLVAPLLAGLCVCCGGLLVLNELDAGPSVDWSRPLYWFGMGAALWVASRHSDRPLCGAANH